MHRSPAPRLATPFAGLLLLVAASVALGADAWAAAVTSRQPSPTSPGTGAVEAATVNEDVTSGGTGSGALGAPATVLPRAVFPEDVPGWREGIGPAHPVVEATAPRPVATPSPAKAAPAPTTLWWKRYHGTNHVWMPTLGINRAVYLFPCSRSRDPDNLVYRWGCAGSNNVYLLGHAYGVFKAVHDAYFNGRLRKGMPVVYADGSGRVRLYRVVSWRVVDPYQVAWAIASQPLPSMTLQTCIGPNSSMRLNVRLVVATR